VFKKTVRLILLLALAALIIFSALELNSNTPVAVLNRLVKQGKLNANTINLQLNYLLIFPAGQAGLHNLGKEEFRKENLLHIRAEARTFDFVKSIFHAKARVDSYIDPKELHSIYFLQHLEMINKPDENKEIQYDQKKHIMTYHGPRGIEERVIDEHAQDPLSAFYYLQNKKFSVGDEFNLSFNTNQKNYLFKGKFISKELIKAGGKEYEVMMAQAHVGRKDRNPRHQVNFRLWFVVSEGKNIPILVKIMTNLGPIAVKAH